MSMAKNKFINCISGFTLAEVLITLVIIGVVAALVISPLVNTYVESSTVSKVKKGLSILGQAKKLAEVDNGPVEGWDFGEGYSSETNQQFWNYLKQHISVTKDCGTNTDCYHTNAIYHLNGENHGINHSSDNNYYKFVLADGSVMYFRTALSQKCSTSEGGVDNVCAVFFYDVNGSKSPNMYGKDIFLYFMTPNGVYPDLRTDCKKNASGQGCAGYIIKHNNMNYLH